MCGVQVHGPCGACGEHRDRSTRYRVTRLVDRGVHSTDSTTVRGVASCDRNRGLGVACLISILGREITRAGRLPTIPILGREIRGQKFFAAPPQGSAKPRRATCPRALSCVPRAGYPSERANKSGWALGSALRPRRPGCRLHARQGDLHGRLGWRARCESARGPCG